ncbi:amidohydrolase family protein [Parapusillimonas granuli]|uniref:Amidohydrolase family protein n=1 Tax=Parapusillimonas granuli TaxID=380911 RepID=A0A853FUN8_9BURK|nr:imidazolonepropionase-like amidohydrolase [Parapusillimonas granuli]MEB2400970.1 amidohydrolase family protein [Alcaligenaceae bacterium]NYT49684.1 amidohydrolase family protein [Parapusillimonas granuli]
MSAVLFKNGNLLDPTQPELLEGYDVLVEDGKIKEVSDKPLSSSSARVIDAAGKTVMPGLIDLHGHVMATQLNLSSQGFLPDALVMMRAVPIMSAMLRRGFTTLRDAGGAGWGLKCAVEEDTIVGPRLFISGRALSQTGGHGDPRQRSDQLRPMSFCGCCFRAGDIGRVVDGVDNVRRAVREEFQMGADQIKIMASGGVASPTDPIAAYGYSEDEIAAIVDEARSRQTYVMAHSYTADAIERAVRNGVRTIEHGNLIDERVARLMAEKGAYVVPTLVTYEALANEGATYGLPADSVAKIATVRTAGLESLQLYKRAGVKMGFGSDLLGPSQRLQSDEFRIRAEVLSNFEVIQSATLIGAEVLNMQGRLGQLAEGAMADVLVVDGNPYKDIGCLLGQGDHIPLVMKGGKIYHDELA